MEELCVRWRDSPCGRLATSAVAMLAEVFDQKMAIVDGDSKQSSQQAPVASESRLLLGLEDSLAVCVCS